jgi:hypothetical protein
MIRHEGGSVMAKVMWLLGLLLVAAGIALGAKSIMSPGQMQIYGLTPETAAILLVGGILSIGLGRLIDGQGYMPAQIMPTASAPIEVQETYSAPVEEPTRIPGFGRKSAEATITAAVATTAATAIETKSNVPSVADTIAALEQAKSDIKTALGGVENMSTPLPEPLAPAHAEEIEDESGAAEGELFVVEEKIIRGRPSRILSDDTVEAETDEGWMRFENLEHLNEYLDSLVVDEA